jgi:glycerol uptake facilitator-like aquaporin
MKSLEPIIFIFAAIIIAFASAGITALYYRARLRRVSKQSWNQARVFYTRRAASHIIR